jgi:hypothetical protein
MESSAAEYREWLFKGSKFHKATGGPNDFMIGAADEGSEGRRQFHMIVDEAIRRQPTGGYRIMTHRDSINPGDLFDRADITVP